jgi:hypothetical protein
MNTSGNLALREKSLRYYVPKFEPGFTGDVLGVEAEWTGQYQTRQRKVRGVDQYWLFYPIAGEEQLNSAMEGLTKMKY